MTRYGLLADVHGNLSALRAAVGHLREEGVTAWLCAGDVVGYGPQPNECIDLLRDLDAVGVAGNHDLIAIGALSDARCSALARTTQHWTHQTLREDNRAWLAALPRRAIEGRVVVAHGSLDDPEEYVRTRERASEQLDQLQRDHPDAEVLVLGHTHRQMVCEQRGRRLVNPGSVGQSRQRERRPKVRCGLLDTGRGDIRLVALDYDLATCRGALQAAGLPWRAVHAPPGAALALAGRVRRLLS